MKPFEVLVASRKGWINEVLEPWCQQASRAELLKAEIEWLDIAGKVAPEKTLWRWAWSRFPELVHENLGIEETSRIRVELRDGRAYDGYPDAAKAKPETCRSWEAWRTPKNWMISALFRLTMLLQCEN